MVCLGSTGLVPRLLLRRRCFGAKVEGGGKSGGWGVVPVTAVGGNRRFGSGGRISSLSSVSPLVGLCSLCSLGAVACREVQLGAGAVVVSRGGVGAGAGVDALAGLAIMQPQCAPEQ